MRGGHSRRGRGARPPGLTGVREGLEGGAGATAAGCRAGDRPSGRRASQWTDSAQSAREADGPALRHTQAPSAAGSVGGPTAAHAPPHAASHLRRHHATPEPTCVTCRSPPATPTPNDHALRPGPQEPRPPPQLHPRRLQGLRHLTNTERPVLWHVGAMEWITTTSLGRPGPR
jgi:hypothetical protein